MPTLTITIGLPGSGKTTWAQAQVAQHEDTVRVNRDDLRMMLFGAYVIDRAQEPIVTVAQEAQVTALLVAGQSVIVDDTNLHPPNQRFWETIASRTQADFIVQDMTAISADECKLRVTKRAQDGGRFVPHDVIDRMAKRIP